MSVPVEHHELVTVYHEIGHAIACEFVGYTVTGIKIGDFPICRFQVPRGDAEAIGVSGELTAGGSRRLMVAVAGRICERIACDLDDWGLATDLEEAFDLLESGILAEEVRFELELTESDAALAFDLLNPLGRADALAELRRAEAEVQAILTDRWTDIEARVGELAP